MSTSSSEVSAIISRTPAAPRFPWRLATVAVIVAIIEITVRLTSQTPEHAAFLLANRFYEPNRPIPIERSIVQWQVYHAINGRRPIDVLFIGDCSCALGYDPRIVERQTGLSAWNLGTMGTFGPQGHCDLFTLFAQERGVPKYLVFQTTQAMVTREPGWTQLLRDWIQPISGEYSSLHLPSWYRRNSVRNLVFNLSTTGDYPEAFRRKKFPDGLPLCDLDIDRTLRENQGYLPRIEDDWSKQGPSPITGTWQAVNDPGLRCVFETAKRYGTQVLLTITPTPEYARTPETEATTGLVVAKLKALAAPYGNVEIAPAEYYPDEMFTGLYHLNEKGAERNTLEVSQWLKSKATPKP